MLVKYRHIEMMNTERKTANFLLSRQLFMLAKRSVVQLPMTPLPLSTSLPAMVLLERLSLLSLPGIIFKFANYKS